MCIVTIDYELCQADIDTIQKREEKIVKQVRALGKDEEKRLAPYRSAVAKILPLLQDGTVLIQKSHLGPGGDIPPLPVDGGHLHLILPLHTEPVPFLEVYKGAVGVVGEDPHVGLLHVELDGAQGVLRIVRHGRRGQRQDQDRDQYRQEPFHSSLQPPDSTVQNSIPWVAAAFKTA